MNNNESLNQYNNKVNSFRSKRKEKYIMICNNYFTAQEAKFFEYCLSGWKTEPLAEKEIPMRISNITVYKRELEKRGLLLTGSDVINPISGMLVCQITTDPDLVTKRSINQPELFQ